MMKLLMKMETHGIHTNIQWWTKSIWNTNLMVLQLIPKELRELKDGIEVRSSYRKDANEAIRILLLRATMGVTYQSTNIRFDFRPQQCKSITIFLRIEGFDLTDWSSTKNQQTLRMLLHWQSKQSKVYCLFSIHYFRVSWVWILMYNSINYYFIFSEFNHFNYIFSCLLISTAKSSSFMNHWIPDALKYQKPMQFVC